jgi:hypothetical protein
MKKIPIKNIEKAIKKEDASLILHEPIEVIKYGRKFIFKPILWKDWEKFAFYMGSFVQYYHRVCGFSMLPDNLNELEEFAKNLKTTLMTGKQSSKLFFKMMDFSYRDKRFIKKNFTLDDMAEFMVYAYLTNIKSVKKNFKIVYDQLMAA